MREIPDLTPTKTPRAASRGPPMHREPSARDFNRVRLCRLKDRQNFSTRLSAAGGSSHALSRARGLSIPQRGSIFCPQ